MKLLTYNKYLTPYMTPCIIRIGDLFKVPYVEMVRDIMEEEEGED